MKVSTQNNNLSSSTQNSIEWERNSKVKKKIPPNQVITRLNLEHATHDFKLTQSLTPTNFQWVRHCRITSSRIVSLFENKPTKRGVDYTSFFTEQRKEGGNMALWQVSLELIRSIVFPVIFWHENETRMWQFVLVYWIQYYLSGSQQIGQSLVPRDLLLSQQKIRFQTHKYVTIR